ncbi:hypothetical protein ACOMHN_026745 [Nucella lapillus]
MEHSEHRHTSLGKNENCTLICAHLIATDDAQYLGSGFLGPVAGNLPYDGWRYKFKPPKDDKSGIPPLNVVYTTAFSKEGCVPIVMGAHYPDGNIEDQLIMYSNFQPKLTDPSAFTLPKICFA